jgi:hypothetical protein
MQPPTWRATTADFRRLSGANPAALCLDALSARVTHLKVALTLVCGFRYRFLKMTSLTHRHHPHHYTANVSAEITS